MKYLALMFVMLTACGGDDGEGNPTPDAAEGTADAPSQMFPAVCDEFPLECPDSASLAACEAGDARAFSSCEYLPLTFGCATVGCPSRAQICRTAEDPNGYCTHSCVNDDDCPLEGGGQGTCTTLNGTVSFCVTN
jgi:hypothetical protein